MQKSSSKNYFADDPYWQVQEVLDIHDGSRFFNQIYYDNSHQERKAESVLEEQSASSEQQSSKISISKLFSGQKSEQKLASSNLKRSQMTLLQDSLEAQVNSQAQFQIYEDQSQTSFIVQECQNSQEQHMKQVIKAVKCKPFKTKFNSEQKSTTQKKITRTIHKIQENILINKKNSRLQKKQDIKLKQMKKQNIVPIKKDFDYENVNQQNTEVSGVKKEFQILQQKEGLSFGHYKILSKQEKEYLVLLSQRFGVSQIAKVYKISVNNICRWKKSCERKIGAGRKITNYQLQTKMIEFVQKANQAGRKLSRKSIQDQAKKFSDDNNFKASKGWFQRFVQRNKFLFDEESAINET